MWMILTLLTVVAGTSWFATSGRSVTAPAPKRPQPEGRPLRGTGQVPRRRAKRRPRRADDPRPPNELHYPEDGDVLAPGEEPHVTSATVALAVALGLALLSLGLLLD
jgi:hypothetical protein